MRLDVMIFVFWMLSFKSDFSLSSFTLIQQFFSSSSLSTIIMLSSAYLRLLVLLPSSAFLHNMQGYVQESDSGCSFDWIWGKELPFSRTASTVALSSLPPISSLSRFPWCEGLFFRRALCQMHPLWDCHACLSPFRDPGPSPCALVETSGSEHPRHPAWFPLSSIWVGHVPWAIQTGPTLKNQKGPRRAHSIT